MTGRVPRIGVSLTAAFLDAGGHDPLSAVRAAVAAELDYVQFGDHVSFYDGTGFDGLIHATACLAAQNRVPVSVGLYLLALRHPVAVARQVADIERLFPGRLTLGVGVGGEDRHEFAITGVDPATRGRRTDEALDVLRRLLTGEPVSHHGEFYEFDDAVIAPPPPAPLPITIGGRSDAAARRAARYGDGWLGLWVSARRFAEVVDEIDSLAATEGRQVDAWRHGLNLWCGVPGSDGRGRDRLATAMEGRYKVPFERFEKWCPVGEPAELAAYVSDYVDVGCTEFTLVLPTESTIDGIEAAAEVRRLVRSH